MSKLFQNRELMDVCIEGGGGWRNTKAHVRGEGVANTKSAYIRK